jgi:hypothetical protein
MVDLLAAWGVSSAVGFLFQPVMAKFAEDLGIVESPVIVTFLEAKSPEVTPQKMYFGMFAANNRSTEEDLKIKD